MASQEKKQKPAPRASALSRFLKRLPLALIAAVCIWLLLRPALDSSIRWTSETLVRAFEYPRVTMLERNDHRVEIHRSDMPTSTRVLSLSLTEIHFNTLLLLALYLALPRPFSRRQLERLFMGWSLLFLSQSLNLVLHVKCYYATGLGAWSLQTYSAVTRFLFEYGQYFTDLPGRFGFPFIIWLGYNWDQVMALVGRAPAEEKLAEQRPRQQRPKKTKKSRKH